LLGHLTFFCSTALHFFARPSCISFNFYSTALHFFARPPCIFLLGRLVFLCSAILHFLLTFARPPYIFLLDTGAILARLQYFFTRFFVAGERVLPEHLGFSCVPAPFMSIGSSKKKKGPAATGRQANYTGFAVGLGGRVLGSKIHSPSLHCALRA
jgi:hypothetical protein